MPDGAGQPDDLLSRKEIAARVNAHIKTVARWIKEGRLPPPDFEIEGFRRWRRDTIDAWILLRGRSETGKQGAGGSLMELKGASPK